MRENKYHIIGISCFSGKDGRSWAKVFTTYDDVDEHTVGTCCKDFFVEAKFIETLNLGDEVFARYTCGNNGKAYFAGFVLAE